MNPGDYLKDVPENSYFRLSDGRVIRNIEELLNVLKNSDDSLFYQHVTPDRNDFAEWIKHCVKYVELYNKLIIIKDRQSLINILEQELAFLKNPKISETMKFFSENYSANDTNHKSENMNVQSNISDVKSVAENTNITNNNTNNNSTNNKNEVKNSDVLSNVVSSNVLDFELFLGDIVKEINDEIFFL